MGVIDYFINKSNDFYKIAKSFFMNAGFKRVKFHSEGVLLLINDSNEITGIVLDLSNETEQQNHKKFYGLIEDIINDNENIKLYLIYNDSSSLINKFNQYRKICFNLVPIPFEKLIRAQFHNHYFAIGLIRESEDWYINQSDPYAVFKPVSDSLLFYGRNQLINKISSLLLKGLHLGIFGMRKVGKTSLLVQLIKNQLSATPSIYINCQTFSSEAKAYFNEILNQLYSELRIHRVKNLPKTSHEANTPDEFKNIILSYIAIWENSNNQPILIIFDEIDKLFPSRDLKNSEEILHEFVNLFKILRNIAINNRLVIMVSAYHPNINRHNLLSPSIGENPMFSIFEEEYIGFLDKNESCKLIKNIGALKNIYWENDAADKVYYYCGGHPFITMLFSSRACDRGELDYIDIDMVEVTADNIIKNFRKNSIGNYYHEGVWNLLSDEEKKVLILICQHDDESKSKIQIPIELENGLAQLERFGLILNENTKLYLNSQLFYFWLKRRFSNEGQSFEYAGLKDDQNTIIRLIEFPAEYQQAGMSILSYFSKILNKKYTNQKVSVTIKQEDLKVTMIIETPDGKRDEIEKTLYEYGLVVTGKMEPQKFVDDQFEILELQNQLTWAKAQIETQNRIMNYQDEEIKKKDIRIDKFLSIMENAFQNKVNIDFSPKVIQADSVKIADKRGILVEGTTKGNIQSGNGRN